jgi:uncharacterized damage-inducible protein DinB
MTTPAADYEVQTTMRESLLDEYREEVATTRRVLERVPQDQLSWRPHPRSMSLGQLVNHIATVPASAAMILRQDSFDVLQANFEPPEAKSMVEALATFDQNTCEAANRLQTMTEEQAQGPWRLTRGDRELFTKPRSAIIRTIVMNHWYHHRGQLSVYLRLLDVPLPVIYGPSADESPF